MCESIASRLSTNIEGANESAVFSESPKREKDGPYWRIGVDMEPAKSYHSNSPMNSLAGHFLIARPVLRDPNFARSVVLILQHGSAGAFGLVVNRKAKLKDLPFPVYVG